MQDVLKPIKLAIAASVASHFQVHIEPQELVLSETKKEFAGQYTWVVFPFVKLLKSAPQKIAEIVGQGLMEDPASQVIGYNVIKGFLNLELNPAFWQRVIHDIYENPDYGRGAPLQEKVLVEFASPNTNKPLHLGHIRNILLGWSTSQILEFCGYQVVKTQIVNDRGIAICKSMLAWKEFGQREDPSSSGIKGDLLVGRYYRKFEEAFSEEYTTWQDTDEAAALYSSRQDDEQSTSDFFKQYKNTYFNTHSRLGGGAKSLLRAWETGDEAVRTLWRTMNGWVYDGFNATYEALGVTFDTIYYESDTYLLGKDIIRQGLEGGEFYREEDGSVWVDLEDVGLDKKILLRSDGTSVYMTQDLGTAQLRYQEHGARKMIYVVGDEQDYHFQVLFEILKKLHEPYANGLFHLSYGMVDLPTGRMKSREGTVVDADDLIHEVIDAVRTSSRERGELEDLNEHERESLYRVIGLAALKFFILRVNPQRRMIFNPADSVDIQGQTGPYIQNAYVRIQSILRKLQIAEVSQSQSYLSIEPTEIDMIRTLLQFPEDVQKAAELYDPSIIANFAYDLAKKFHKFYHEVRIVNADSEEARAFRVVLIKSVARQLETCMKLLGVDMPERM